MMSKDIVAAFMAAKNVNIAFPTTSVVIKEDINKND